MRRESLGTTATNGKAITAFTPPPAPNVTSTAPIDVANGVKEPGTCDAQHGVLEARATCGFFCTFPGETVDFLPPQLMDNPSPSTCLSGGDLVEYTTTAMKVYIQHKASVPIHITVTDTSKSHFYFSLGDSPSTLQPAGIPAHITIPAGQLSATYYARSVVGAAPYPAQFVIQFTAPGTATGSTTGVIVSGP